MARRVLHTLDPASLDPTDQLHLERAQAVLGRDPLAVYIAVGVSACLIAIVGALYLF